jgi:hypothetical protein
MHIKFGHEHFSMKKFLWFHFMTQYLNIEAKNGEQTSLDVES